MLSCNRFNPGFKLFMSYSSMCGSTIYYKKTTWRLRNCFFYFCKSMPENVQHFNPRVEIVHVIAKNFNSVNRAEFNPRVESAPCNQLLMPSADNAEQISLKAKD